MIKINVLVACEESQAVTIELRKLGHVAYSCDILPCSGGHPEWHLFQDVLPLLDPYDNGIYWTYNEKLDIIYLPKKWDMIIAFPPCTYLTNAGAMRLRVNGKIQYSRMEKAIKAKEFFMKFYNVNCSKVAIENPLPGKIHELPCYTQVIEPYMFGDPWKKKTCLWLRGLQPLVPTNIIKPKGLWVGATSSRRNENVYSSYILSSNRDPKIRAKTFHGIAKAMAAQWTNPNYEQLSFVI